MENLEKGNYKKPTMFQGCPMFHTCRSFLSQEAGEQWAGFWWWCIRIQKAYLRAGHPLGDAVSSAGYIQRYFSVTFRWCSLAKVFLPGRFARWDGLTWDPKPSGFSTAVQTEALPADYGSFPEWLSSGVWKNSLGLKKGRGQLTQSNCGKGQYEEWISPARRKVFGFPRSMGRHRSWYSKCLLHCTSLWKKIVCWKVSKQTLY